MAKKKSKPAAPAETRSREIPKKQPVVMIAVVAFVVGFLSGVGFTVYRTSSKSALPVAQNAPAPGAAGQTGNPSAVLEMAVKQNPNDAGSWTQLGNFYFDSGQYEKAVQAYEKSLAIAPNNANVITDLGVMYRRTKKPKIAVEMFERAIAVDPQHETARFNKGIVLLHDLNDRDGAIASWEALMAVNPVAMTPSGMSVDEMITQFKKQAAKEK